jgi:hypothetical protein
MKSREALHRVCAGGLKARQSSAQGNALCHVRHLSTPQALKGRHPDKPIPPLQGLALVGHSFRRALPCAIDYRAFSPYDPSNGYMLKISHP